MGTKNVFSTEASYGKGLFLCSMFDDRITRKLCILRKQELGKVYADSCEQCKSVRNSGKKSFARARRKQVLNAVNHMHTGGEGAVRGRTPRRCS